MVVGEFMQIPLWVFLISVSIFIGILFHQNKQIYYWSEQYKRVSYVLNMYSLEYGVLSMEQLKKNSEEARRMVEEDE